VLSSVEGCCNKIHIFYQKVKTESVTPGGRQMIDTSPMRTCPLFPPFSGQKARPVPRLPAPLLDRYFIVQTLRGGYPKSRILLDISMDCCILMKNRRPD